LKVKKLFGIYFVLWMNYFNTLVLYLFRLTLKPSRSLKNLYFGTIIHRQPWPSGDGTAHWDLRDICDTVRYKDVMKGYDIGPNEEIRTFTWGEDATIGTKAVLLHHVFVPHRVADINVGPKWKCHHRRVKVNDIYMFLNKDFFYF